MRLPGNRPGNRTDVAASGTQQF